MGAGGIDSLSYAQKYIVIAVPRNSRSEIFVTVVTLCALVDPGRSVGRSVGRSLHQSRKGSLFLAPWCKVEACIFSQRTVIPRVFSFFLQRPCWPNRAIGNAFEMFLASSD